MLARFRKIGVKLAVLAGVPVVGAILLAANITREASERARSAEGIGSVEDLVELSGRMTDAVAELQTERALAALTAGFETPDTSALVAQEAKTDAAVRAMDEFLAQRDLSRLPLRLSGDLTRARAQLGRLGAERQKLVTASATIDEILAFYGGADSDLISASAALTQLSNDGELLRGLSALVATMQVKERSSREHAVLNHTFAHGAFAPGLYRYFVTLVTEEGVYRESLQRLASDDQAQLLAGALHSQAGERALQMRQKALEAVDDDFGIDAKAWFDTQSEKIAALGKVERELARRARNVAKSKVVATRTAVEYSRNLVFAVVATSLLLAWIIGRNISRSVLNLARVSERVQKGRDFSLRAEKVSGDELGGLTDAFNDMLSGIQSRDQELEEHRKNLEVLVQVRTQELEKRNRDLRLVLDTVDQGLVTLGRDGTMSIERSRAFDAFFGVPAPGTPFFEHLAGRRSDLAMHLQLDWEQLLDGFLPTEVVLGQALKRLDRDDKNYELSYKPMFDGESVRGALLMVSDVTAEVAARKAEAAQREAAKMVERFLNDQAGFRVFLQEARRLYQHIVGRTFASATEEMRALHTLKGNAAMFDVDSVARAAHALEQVLLEGEGELIEPHLHSLREAWEGFESRIAAWGLDGSERFELTRGELSELIAAAKPYPRVEALVRRIENEPVQAQLSRAGEQMRRLAQRLGKEEPVIAVQTDGARLPTAQVGQFWTAFAHVVRNVVDHALYTSEESAVLGVKNQVVFRARQVEKNVVIEIVDNGRGVDWDVARARASAKGLPHASRDELEQSLFADGVSTALVTTDISGRGVGLSAVAAACRALGGSYSLSSELGHGAHLAFTIPIEPTGGFTVRSVALGHSP
jgi:two-component system, chemotaxis family, sensor kinase CheA